MTSVLSLIDWFCSTLRCWTKLHIVNPFLILYTKCVVTNSYKRAVEETRIYYMDILNFYGRFRICAITNFIPLSDHIGVTKFRSYRTSGVTKFRSYRTSGLTKFGSYSCVTKFRSCRTSGVTNSRFM